MKDINKLRQQCLTLMVKKGMIKKGSQAVLAQMIKTNKNQLSMALTGYRNTAGSVHILYELKRALLKMEPNNTGKAA